MAIEIGIWLCLVGGLAALTGLTGMRRLRRLRSDGVAVWAMAVPRTAPPGEVADDPSDQTVLQYELEDGRVLERIGPGTSLRAAARLQPGQRVLVWYDPADPDDIMVFGRSKRRVDEAFVAVGVLLVVAGATFVAFAR